MNRKYLLAVAICMIVGVSASMGQTKKGRSGRNPGAGPAAAGATQAPLAPDAVARILREKNEQFDKWDKRGLRHSIGMVTDSSAEMLEVPAFYKEWREFEVAKTPPIIDFAPMRNLHPEFQADNIGEWTNWGEVTRGPNGCYYMGVGNHRKGTTGNVLYIIEFDPVKKEQRQVVDLGSLLGWKPGQYEDTMLHGRMNILPDGTLVAATWLGHYGDHDLSTEAVRSNWYGSWLFTYNVYTRKAESHGIPMLNCTWPMFNTDARTGVFMAVGVGYADGYPDPRWSRNQHYFLAYNVNQRKVIYAGLPPGNIDLSERATLIDTRTGLLYSSDGNNDNTIVCYDQRTNRWRDLPCKIPPNPATGKSGILRAYTYRPAPDGAYYCIDGAGTFFKFYPDAEKTELLGAAWGKEGLYTASMRLSPQGRYIYYLPDAEGHALQYEQPVVQYDTRTGRQKVLAFLSPYLHQEYGYVTRGTYGIELSEDGSLLVVAMNGTFNPEPRKGRFSHPSIMAIHIPESERRE